RATSEKRALELIALGETISAQSALEAGLINRVAPDAELDSAFDDYVSVLAAKSASAVRLSKRLLYHMDGMPFESAVEAGAQVNAIARMTEDCRQGIQRFLK